MIYKTQSLMSRESGEEDLDARELLRRGYSAGPVSPTCYDLKGESWLRAATLDDSKTPNPVLCVIRVYLIRQVVCISLCCEALSR
jgi:hypothetical protein